MVYQITRPKIVTNYQNNFRGVDLCDQLRAKYPVGRSVKKVVEVHYELSFEHLYDKRLHSMHLI